MKKRSIKETWEYNSLEEYEAHKKEMLDAGWKEDRDQNYWDVINWYKYI